LLQHHVRIHSFERYFLGAQTRTGLIFGFGTVDLPDIRRGLTQLRNILSK
jgi:GntR family transcriptional regulator / MocR family aminotransferase